MVIFDSKYGDLSVPIPVRHRRKVPFLPRLNLSDGTGARLAKLQELDRELSQYIVPAADFRERVEEVVASNLHSSVRLEGNPIELSQVRLMTRQSLQGQLRSDEPPTRREVLNHLAVWFTPEDLSGPWSLNTLTGLHRALLDGVDPKALPGRLRTRASAIYSDEGEELFVTAPPAHIAEELESLLDWLNHDASALSPVVAGAVFFHEFESIHPFEEGNGRTGRVLFHAYLQNHGLTSSYRCGIEAELLLRPEIYYRVLSWTDLREEYGVLVDFFVDSVLTAYEAANTWYRERDVLRELEPLSRLLLHRAFMHRTPFDLRTAHSWVPSRGEQVLRLRLRGLVKAGMLISEGNTRALKYRFADPLADLQRRVNPLRLALGFAHGVHPYRVPNQKTPRQGRRRPSPPKN